MLKQLLFKTDRRCLYKFVYNMGIKGAVGFSRFQKRLKKGEFFPAFHFISVTDDCNLNCQGCWVMGKKKNSRMSPEQLDRIITETKAQGSYFFGILGGEPLLYKPLFDIFKKHSDCYFQLFTNGTLLTPEVAEKLRACGNVNPLISFEGDEQVADVRRGGNNVFQRTQKAIENATQAGLITGVAISVCKSNLEMALSDEFMQSLVDKGVLYLWYYIYRPVGENATVELCLDRDEIDRLRRHMVEARTKSKLLIIDAYWDGDGNGLCPAASGLSHHINASGYIEPCPVIQFAADHVDDKPLKSIYKDSAFLWDLKAELTRKTSGCIVMEDPQWLADFVEKYGAVDSSGRDNEAERLRQMPRVCSHGSGTVIPEKNKLYRFAKNRAFFGLGAYG
ncbi:radical SAM protein [Mangrovibacterium diazotrophicum]|uniref:MoaA/NifB/PqqE/SkfB family radical SAM enzyme n=1 Tax=Mangrovibacterium diazotrophicum TaxID=1261403 RepID=A0A419VX72_9BACT|nr:radical SAM protein [Mangrovibacterium diazotrophicum]RKD87796.1 MoaA/NifB/PqqE/SkfB family radical SAM enzyme [Mangrovibacterium diazotrophicum]